MSLPAPLPMKNKKTCFASGRVEWGGLWHQAGPHSKAASGQAACCYWSGSWLPSARFLQLSKPGLSWRAGESPLLQAAARPPVTTWDNGLEGLEGAHQSSPSVPGSHQRQGQVAVSPASPPRLVFHLAGHIVSTTGQGKQWPQEASLGCCWVLQLWEVAEREEGPQRDQHCTGSILLGTVANESGVSFREHLEDLVSLHLCVSSGPA